MLCLKIDAKITIRCVVQHTNQVRRYLPTIFVSSFVVTSSSKGIEMGSDASVVISSTRSVMIYQIAS